MLRWSVAVTRPDRVRNEGKEDEHEGDQSSNGLIGYIGTWKLPDCTPIRLLIGKSGSSIPGRQIPLLSGTNIEEEEDHGYRTDNTRYEVRNEVPCSSYREEVKRRTSKMRNTWR